MHRGGCSTRCWSPSRWSEPTQRSCYRIERDLPSKRGTSGLRGLEDQRPCSFCPTLHIAEAQATTALSIAVNADPIVDDLKPTRGVRHGEDHVRILGMGMTANVGECLPEGGQEMMGDRIGNGGSQEGHQQ